VAWPSKGLGDTANQGSVNKQANQKGYSNRTSNSFQENLGTPSWNFTSRRNFSYATADDIAYCIGVPVAMVEGVVNLLKIRPPFSLGEANRIADELVGEPSIRKAFDRTQASSDLRKPTASSAKTYSTSSQASDDRLDNVVPNELLRQVNHRFQHPPQDWQFSYATIDDISYCTGKPVGLVRQAVKSLHVGVPFTLVEADRIAGFLLGDPSIRRAYDKTVSSRSSGAKASVVTNARDNSTLEQPSSLSDRERQKMMASAPLTPWSLSP
jgi:hypothetical protein